MNTNPQQPFEPADPEQSQLGSSQPPLPTVVPGETVASPTKSGPPRPRTGAIVWGTLVLVFCAYVAAIEMGGAVDPVTWIIATFIGLGVLLLGVGVTILLRGAAARR